AHPGMPGEAEDSRRTMARVSIGKTWLLDGHEILSSIEGGPAYGRAAGVTEAMRLSPPGDAFLADMRKFWDNSADPWGAGVLAREAPLLKPVPASLSIGTINISPATVLAPMAGVT